MTDGTEPARYASEYPDGNGTLRQDQIVLVDEVIDDPHVPATTDSCCWPPQSSGTAWVAIWVHSRPA
jgi:hypothetical protein